MIHLALTRSSLLRIVSLISLCWVCPQSTHREDGPHVDDPSAFAESDTREEVAAGISNLGKRHRFSELGPFWSWCVNSSGDLLATAHANGLAVWDFNTGQVIERFEFEGFPLQIKFNHDDSLLVVKYQEMLGAPDSDVSFAVWNRDSGARCASGMLTQSTPDITWMVVSPKNDEIASSALNQLTIRDANSGRRLRNWEFQNRIKAIAYAPSAETIYVLDTERIFEIDATTGQEVDEVIQYRSDRPFVSTFETDLRGQHLLINERQGGAWIVNLRRKQKYSPAPSERGSSSFFRAALSPDGDRFVATTVPDVLAGDPAELLIGDVESGRWLHELTGFNRAIGSIGFRPDSHQLIFSRFGQTGISTLGLEAGDGGSPEFPHGNGVANSLAIAPNGRSIAAASSAGHVFLVDSSSGAIRSTGLAKVVTHLEFDPAGKSLVAIHDLRELTQWDIENDRQIGQGTLARAEDMDLERRVRKMISGRREDERVPETPFYPRQIRRETKGHLVSILMMSTQSARRVVWDSQNHRFHSSSTWSSLLEREAFSPSVAISNDGLLVRLESDGVLRFRNRELPVDQFIPLGVAGESNACGFVADAKLVACCIDHHVVLADLDNGDVISLGQVVPKQRSGEPNATLLTQPSSHRFIVVSGPLINRTATLFDARRREVVASRTLGANINAACLSEDGRFAAFGLPDGRVQFWDIDAMVEKR